MATVSSLMRGLADILEESGDLEVFFHETDLGRIYELRSLVVGSNAKGGSMVVMSSHPPEDYVAQEKMIDCRKEGVN